jgi:hypothetical protein
LGSETWSLTLREEYRLGVFQDLVLRKILGPKKDEITGKDKDVLTFKQLITTT